MYPFCLCQMLPHLIILSISSGIRGTITLTNVSSKSSSLKMEFQEDLRWKKAFNEFHKESNHFFSPITLNISLCFWRTEMSVKFRISPFPSPYCWTPPSLQPLKILHFVEWLHGRTPCSHSSATTPWPRLCNASGCPTATLPSTAPHSESLWREQQGSSGASHVCHCSRSSPGKVTLTFPGLQHFLSLLLLLLVYYSAIPFFFF